MRDFEPLEPTGFADLDGAKSEADFWAIVEAVEGRPVRDRSTLSVATQRGIQADWDDLSGQLGLPRTDFWTGAPLAPRSKWSKTRRKPAVLQLVGFIFVTLLLATTTVDTGMSARSIAQRWAQRVDTAPLHPAQRGHMISVTVRPRLDSAAKTRADSTKHNTSSVPKP